MQYALEISHLVKKYTDTQLAVNDISFTITQGDFFGFLGPNGAGKSSTIHAITGISRFNSGTIRVCGHDVVTDYREARKHIGLSPQDFNVDMFEKTYNILWYMGGFYGMPAAQRKERIAQLLKQFELEAHAQKRFRELSGGLKRRVMLARAMIHNPDLLILDEPTAGVDVELRRELWKYLELINKQGKTILLTTHYLEEVERLCNTVAFINKGKLIKIGKKTDFIQNGTSLEDVYVQIIEENNGQATQ